MDTLNDIKWGGSGIERVVFEWILNNIQEGSEVIEIGAGYCSTNAFRLHYRTTSIEHNDTYIGLFDGVNYIKAELTDTWYDRESIKAKLPKKNKQALIFIDGTKRDGILDNLDLFNKKAKYLIHDTYRDGEIALAHKLADKLKRKVTFYTDGDYWAVI